METHHDSLSSRVVRAPNAAGETVGSARRGAGGGRGHRGFLLKSGPLQERGLPGSDYSAALGINNLGQVVGYGDTAPLRCELSAPPDYRDRFPRARSQATTAAWRWPSNQPPGTGGWLFERTHPSSGRRLRHRGRHRGPTNASGLRLKPRGSAINDRGDVLGVCETASGPRAVLWEVGAVQDLGTLPGDRSSEALSSNANGVIVGSRGPRGTPGRLQPEPNMASSCSVSGATSTRTHARPPNRPPSRCRPRRECRRD